MYLWKAIVSVITLINITTFLPFLLSLYAFSINSATLEYGGLQNVDVPHSISRPSGSPSFQLIGHGSKLK